MNAPTAAAVHGASVRRHIPELAIDWLLDAPERRWQVLDGTLCFADISGFTALAERLAQRGRMGGEELISRLGGVFADMLDIARERGGMLLKFGGDALLLFFQGPDHMLQAASAAVAMRKVLRDAAATPTSVGPLRLSMSVGLHSGPVHIFLVGGPHRELVLLGPAAEAVVDTENAADAGEIALSPGTLALLPAGAARPRPDGLPLLRWRKPAIPPCGPRTERPAGEDLLRSLLPGVLSDFLGADAPEPEHRVACIAFIRFSGTDTLLEHHGPDAVAEALDATLGPVQRCLDAEAITLLALDVDKDGGKLFLGSGVPYAHADDEGNMLRALRAIADLDLPLALQMGVSRGHVFAAEVGSASRAAYSAMGDTTNTAARIAAKAPVGAIYAHPAVLDQSMVVFETTPSPPLTMKGKQAPLVVYQIGAQTGTRRREGLGVAEFIGREAEVAVLAQRLEALERGEGGVVCITGDTGMGKSKLIHEVLARADTEPLLALRGEPNAQSSPYMLLRDALLRVFGHDHIPPPARADALLALIETTAPELTEFAPLVGDVLGTPLPPTPASGAIDPQFRPARTADVLLRLMAAHFPGPRIWIFDDAQWCDEASLAILSALADACSGQPWLLITARRPGSGGFDPSSNALNAGLGGINLSPMDPSDVSTLLTVATEAAPLRPHELDMIVTRAGGNPLFALELLRAAREAGSFDAVPESLEAAMAAQVDALDPDARRLLRYASVLGRSFPRRVLEETLRAQGRSLDDGTLARLANFLEPELPDRLRFCSDVICDTTYQAVSYRLRRRLHQTVAATMERTARDPDTSADTLAIHYSRAEDHARALRYARIAADRARDQYANGEAARFYELAIQSGRQQGCADSAALIELLTRLGEVKDRAGMLEGALDAYTRALKLAGPDPEIRAELLHSRATAKERMRAYRGARRDIAAGLQLLKPSASSSAAALRARLLTTLAWISMDLDRPKQALAEARRAECEARAGKEERALALALMIIDLAGLMVSGPGSGEYLEEALRIFRTLDDQRMQASVESNLGVLCAMGGRWKPAAQWFEAAYGRFSRIGDVVRATDPALNLGEMLVKQRRYTEAESVLRDTLRVLRAAHFGEGINRGEMQLARIMIHRGQYDDAERLLERVQHEFAAAGQPVAALETATIRSTGRLRSGDARSALELLDRAIESAGSAGSILQAMVACERVRILAALGEHERAGAELAAGLKAAREQGMPYEEALLLEAAPLVTGVAGQAQGPEDVEAAQAILRSLGVQCIRIE